MFGHPISQVLGNPNFGFVAGRILNNGGTISLQTISAPQVFSGDVSLIKVATGRYQVTITNFQGPNGVVIPWVCAGSTSTAALGVTTVPGLSAGISLNSFSTGTDTYSFTVGVCSGSTFTDAEVYFSAFSF